MFLSKDYASWGTFHNGPALAAHPEMPGAPLDSPDDVGRMPVAPPAAEACGMPGKGAPFPRLGKSPPASLKLASRPAGFRGIQGPIACSLGPGAVTQTLSPELQLRRIRGPGALPRSSPSQRKAPGPSVVPSSPSASPGGRTPKLWAHIRTLSERSSGKILQVEMYVLHIGQIRPANVWQGGRVSFPIGVATAVAVNKQSQITPGT